MRTLHSNPILKLIRNEKGFSLIELMIVVAITGMLASVASQNYRLMMIKTYRARVTSELTSIKTLVSGEAAANDDVFRTTGGGWYCEKPCVWGPTRSDWIPGDNESIKTMPQLEGFNYMYASDGTGYKVLFHCAGSSGASCDVAELFMTGGGPGALTDRARDGGPTAYGAHQPEGACDGSGDGSVIWGMSVSSSTYTCY